MYAHSTRIGSTRWALLALALAFFASAQAPTAAQQVGTIQIASFQNPAGLSAMGGNLLTATSASGTATTANPGENGMGRINQGFLEQSNVSVVEEMVNMIVAQRAYEVNSKAVRAADDMLQQINNLAR